MLNWFVCHTLRTYEVCPTCQHQLSRSQAAGQGWGLLLPIPTSAQVSSQEVQSAQADAHPEETEQVWAPCTCYAHGCSDVPWEPGSWEPRVAAQGNLAQEDPWGGAEGDRRAPLPTFLLSQSPALHHLVPWARLHRAWAGLGENQ